ncbi:hypothetical protein GH714_015230 [Hevea brasiliensis]|uniref:AB hydrolase-1 domain-containing protein n=1 Tax=Hevea brasiliensis TaxID=3981 RepID=A0A6A6KRQ8_HEVBR|nr:hypothetical protein GH714_015230 [Hevea brasiliensis]
MVNLVAAQKPLLHGLMKMAGVKPHLVEIEPGTIMNFWVPVETIKKKKPRKVLPLYPDLLFFGGSITDKTDRSPTFQAETLVKGLKKLGVDKCTVVGFSYGGMVAFKMAELYPELVQAMVVSGSILAMTDSISNTTLSSLGFKSSSELLLPTSVKGLKALLSVAAYKKLWFPNRLHKDFLEVSFLLLLRNLFSIG